MIEEQEDSELRSLYGLRTDAAAFFKKAEEALEGEEITEGVVTWPSRVEAWTERDRYWSTLPEEIGGEAKRLNTRLVSLMGQVALAVRNAPLSSLSSEADQRDVMTSTKAMRAALLLRRFRSWNTEVLNDEDVVLGVTPAGQSDDDPLAPADAGEVFAEHAEKISAIIDLVAASPDVGPAARPQQSEAVRYRPGTAFIMMWMDKAQPGLTDVSDAVKEVFADFDIRAVRADDIEHEELISPRILNEIKTCEFCFADLTGSRPNVYYEVGYAHALRGRVILYRKAGTGLHFDMAGYNCPEYENLRDLKEKLTQRLRVLTNKGPKK
jgi:hypothetical protein